MVIVDLPATASDASLKNQFREQEIQKRNEHEKKRVKSSTDNKCCSIIMRKVEMHLQTFFTFTSDHFANKTYQQLYDLKHKLYEPICFLQLAFLFTFKEEKEEFVDDCYLTN
jgi:hypothetical protein